MEVIVLFYMAISFFIGWAIFSPFAAIEEMREWSFAKPEISDLLALFLPFSFSFSLLLWTVPRDVRSVELVTLFGAGVTLVSFLGLCLSLFFLAKMERMSPAKRMTMIGIVIPVGAFLTLGWISFPLYGFAKSTIFAIPATLFIPVATLILRGLSDWVCRKNPDEQHRFPID